MPLSKSGYFADFVIYPIALLGLAGAALWTPTLERISVWFAVLLCSVALWTLVEYGLHRFVFHRVPYIRNMHEAHHKDQKALIGSPTWLSAMLIAGMGCGPAFLLFGSVIANGFTIGLIVGYFAYFSVHHAIHHAYIGPLSFVYRLKRRHMLHHHFDNTGNFGVTSGLWDKFFRTEITTTKLVGKLSLDGSRFIQRRTFKSFSTKCRPPL